MEGAIEGGYHDGVRSAHQRRECDDDIGGGRIDAYYGVVFEATSGTITPIAVLSEERSAALPDAPVIGEAGNPQARAIWWVVFAIAGTPKEIVDKMNDDIIT